MADQALAIHPRFWKLYLIKAQLLERLENYDAARETLSVSVGEMLRHAGLGTAGLDGTWSGGGLG